MLTQRAPRAPGRRGDDGIALPTVLLSMLVLTAFALASLAFVVQSTPSSRTTADAKAAVAAAQAGVDEYTSRLNGRPTYYATVDATNRAFTQKADGTPFTDGRDPRGATVPGTTDSFFRYRVLTRATTTARDGLIRVRVTGTAAGQSRSLTATYGQDGYLKFLYFTDVEAIDPLLLAGTQSAANRDAYLDHCSNHWYDEPGRTGRWTDTFIYEGKRYEGIACSNIQFAANDVINGPLHTNDSILLGGAATFNNRTVETSWPKTSNPSWPSNKPWRGAFTPKANLPYYAPPPLPLRSNVKLREKAETAEGCLYSGETSIELKGTTMEVLSPATTTSTTGCFDAARRSQKQTYPIRSVVYVRPTTACGPVQLPFGSADKGASIGGTTTTYDCKAGNAYVSGTLNGQTTVAADNDVVITRDLRYAGGLGGDDVLGLIPNNYAWVYHPVEAGGTYGRDVDGKRVSEINAAILSLNRSFLVQNWDKGGNESPNLTVNGVIAQKFRGPVGSSFGTGARTGYTKAYVYDGRLKNLPPPYFLTPEDAPWTVQRLTDG